eukprot:TRINITY_DN15664_c0_g1_i11.p2 TRINITY_DN15664_c0_g1~~TRINITY_DN15664_c0_g1_i11.p2  ORF type:complete len:166 (+),score=55.10 TRINITY_DN15664_c0_g1_i11:552-1049(+)
MTASDELHLLCYWQQLGNKWVKIANLMGRSENWVKNNWKKIMRRERIPSGGSREKIMEYMPALIEKAKQRTLAQSTSESIDRPSEGSHTESIAAGQSVEAMEDVKCRDSASIGSCPEELKAGEEAKLKLFDDDLSSYSEEHAIDPVENNVASGLMDLDKWQFGGY